MRQPFVSLALFNALVLDLRTMHGRELIIYGASLVDSALAHVLRISHFSRLNSNEIRSMFGDGGPAGTLSAKTRLVHALGGITRNTAGQLREVRELRNHFAHSVLLQSFDDDEASSTIANFRLMRVEDIQLPADVPVGETQRAVMPWRGLSVFGRHFSMEDVHVVLTQSGIVAWVTPERVFGPLSLEEQVRHQLWSCIWAIVVPSILVWGSSTDANRADEQAWQIHY